MIEHLRRTLPAIKESQPHFGEWSTTQWTDESLAPFFRGDAEVPKLESGVAIRRFRTARAASITADYRVAVPRTSPRSCKAWGKRSLVVVSDSSVKSMPKCP